jgi:hypothetical protein
MGTGGLPPTLLLLCSNVAVDTGRSLAQKSHFLVSSISAPSPSFIWGHLAPPPLLHSCARSHIQHLGLQIEDQGPLGNMTTCFRTLENTVFNVSNTDIPCTNSNPTGCCSYGDICLSNGICRYTKPTAAESGYYLQSSTDSTFQSTIGQETLHCSKCGRAMSF